MWIPVQQTPAAVLCICQHEGSQEPCVGMLACASPLLPRPGMQGLPPLSSLARTLLGVAVCDPLLSPYRSLATWGNSTVK